MGSEMCIRDRLWLYVIENGRVVAAALLLWHVCWAGGESIRYQLSCVRPSVFVRYGVVCVFLMTSMTGCPYDASLDSVCHRPASCSAVAPEWTSSGYCPASVTTACQARRIAARNSPSFVCVRTVRTVAEHITVEVRSLLGRRLLVACVVTPSPLSALAQLDGSEKKSMLKVLPKNRSNEHLE